MRKWHTCQVEGPLEGRPRRFSVSTRLRYRLANELEWRTGTIENISSSGVVFRVVDLEGLRERDTPLELSFTVPKEIGGDGETQVFSRGYTKRILPASKPRAYPAVAVRITEYLPFLEQGDSAAHGPTQGSQDQSSGQFFPQNAPRDGTPAKAQSKFKRWRPSGSAPSRYPPPSNATDRSPTKGADR